MFYTDDTIIPSNIYIIYMYIYIQNIYAYTGILGNSNVLTRKGIL